MKLWTGVLAAALLIVASEARLVMAQERGRHMGEMKESCESRDADSPQYGHYPHHLLKHAKEIGLIKDQIARLKTIRLDFERACLRSRAEIHVSDLEIETLMDDEKATLATIEAKVKQRATAATALRIAAIKAKRDAMALLTAEQREKDQTIHEKMMQQMQEQQRGMGGMGGGMMGDDMTGGGRRGGGRRGGGGMGGGMMQGGGQMGGSMGGGMMQGGGMMDDGMMEGEQDGSSQQEESQKEHQGQ